MRATPIEAMPVEVYKIPVDKPAEDYDPQELQEWGGANLSVSVTQIATFSKEYTPRTEVNLIASDQNYRADTLRITRHGPSGTSYYLVKDAKGYINILREHDFNKAYHLHEEETA